MNGPPGAGKSALARRFVDEHALILYLEIDAIRVALGRWAELEESRLIARRLALTMADAHLRSGLDVIIPQYLGRVDFVEALEELARNAGADFAEVMLMTDAATAEQRFRERRAGFAATEPAHPEADVPDALVRTTITESIARLERIAASRSRTRIVDATDEPEIVYRALCSALDG